ncbi:Ammonium transporter 1 member 2 [Nymphaea thermarum]|nr:Ammonium transporter 1 member 2 [Nymphaea thermarum]
MANLTCSADFQGPLLGASANATTATEFICGRFQNAANQFTATTYAVNNTYLNSSWQQEEGCGFTAREDEEGCCERRVREEAAIRTKRAAAARGE